MDSHLLIQPDADPARTGELVAVTPRRAGWTYVSFAVWQLQECEIRQDSAGSDEVCLVPLSGVVRVTADTGDEWMVGGRVDPFVGPPDALYLPPAAHYRLTAMTACQVARAGAPADDAGKPYLIAAADVREEARGSGNTSRLVRRILLTDRPAQRLLVSETLTPAGNWSSYPPHKHDTDRPGQESPLEETYYHRFRPAGGFAMQRIYTDDGGLDEALVVQDGSLVLVPRGYHPVAVAPGYDSYYLNVMAGPTRDWLVQEDPRHASVA